MWENDGFVDSMSLASAMNVYLHVPRHQLNDPERKIKDVNRKGQWSRGASLIKLAQSDDIPYMISLMRQLCGRCLAPSILKPALLPSFILRA